MDFISTVYVKDDLGIKNIIVTAVWRINIGEQCGSR